MWECVVAPVIDRGEDGTKKNNSDQHRKPSKAIHQMGRKTFGVANPMHFKYTHRQSR